MGIKINSKNELEKIMLEKQINAKLEDINKLKSAESKINQQFNVANVKLDESNIKKESNTQLLVQQLYQMSEELVFQESCIHEITRIKKALNEEKKILTNKNKITATKKFNILVYTKTIIN